MRDHRFAEAGARRIGEHEIGSRGHAREMILDAALQMLDDDAGALGVDFQIARGGDARFDGGHVRESARQRQREQSDAGVEIERGFARGVADGALRPVARSGNDSPGRTIAG